MSLPYGLDLNNQIDVDKSATRMMVSIEDTTTREQREIEQRGREWLEANAPEYMVTHGSGLTMMWAHLSQRNINSMLVASFGALVLISFILIFALRSVKHGLISLAPNLAPAIMAFGLWGLLVGQVGLGLSVIVSMTLGTVGHRINDAWNRGRRHGAFSQQIPACPARTGYECGRRSTPLV
jgi:predicted RND superfamily exporter protein